MSSGVAGLLARAEGDRQLLSGLIEIYVMDAPAMLAALRRSVAGEDAGAVLRLTHLLRGSTELFGATGVAAAAAAIERLAEDGRLAGAQSHLRALEQEVLYLTEQLRRVNATLAA